MGQQELKPGRWRVRCACLLELVAWIFSTHPACPVLDAGGAVAAAAAAADGLEAEVEVAGKGLHRAVVLGLLSWAVVLGCCPGVLSWGCCPGAAVLSWGWLRICVNTLAAFLLFWFPW